MHKLIKASSPGWEKEFGSQKEATAELLKHVCKSCLAGELEYVDSEAEDGFSVELGKKPDPSDIGALLGTPCGCEYWYEPPSH
jgi:hypothetical protein